MNIELKWTTIHERVNGPFTFECNVAMCTALVMLEDDDNWYFQAWNVHGGQSISQYYDGFAGYHTAAEAKRAAEEWLKENYNVGSW